MLHTGIETFLAIVATGSLSRASSLLRTTQSTVSLRLKNLENELGYVLVDRRRGEKKIALTQAGIAFLKPAEIIRDLLQESTENCSGGSLKIGAVDSVHVFLMPPLYQALSAHNPSVELVLQTHQSVQICDLIEHQELDVGFVLTPRCSPQVRVVPIHEEDFYVMRLQREDSRKVVSAAELSPRTELRIQWGTAFTLWHDSLWDPLVSSQIQLDTLACISQLLRREEQWALVPESARRIYENRFLFQKLDPPPPRRICYKLTHRHPRLGALTGLEILEELLKTMKL